MAKAPAFQFYPADYMRDTRILSLQARGAWTDLLCVMWFSEERGKCNGNVTQMKRLWGVENDVANTVLDELISCKICDIETDCNGNVTLINRRMVRDETERQQTKKRVKRFREKKDVTQKKRKCNAVSSSSSSSSSSLNTNNKKNIYKEIPPKIEDIKTYCSERNNGIDSQVFFDHYEARGWMIGKNKMKNWSAAIRTWESRNKDRPIVNQNDAEKEVEDFYKKHPRS